MYYKTVKKYIYYSIWHDRLKSEQGLSDEKIAHVLGIGIGTLQRAIKWGEANRGLGAEQDILDQHILELKAKIEDRERTIEMLEKKVKEIAKADGRIEEDDGTRVHFVDAPYKSITAYTRAITDHERIVLDMKTRVMELEGIYKETLSVEVGANKSLIDVLDAAWSRRQQSGDDGR